MILNALFLFSAVFSTVAASALVDKWGRCKITDPNLNDCLSKVCSNLFHDLKAGNAELGIPPFEPFTVKKMVLKSGGKGPVNLLLDMDDLTFARITDFTKITADTSQLKDMTLKLTLEIPVMDVTSKYKMSGKILTVPVKGNGDMIVQMRDAKVEFIMHGKPLDKGGKSYWNVNEIKVQLMPNDETLKFTGLFNGDKKLGDATNKVLNDNWRIILKEFGPYISSEFEKAAKPIANVLTQLEPFDEMFPK